MPATPRGRAGRKERKVIFVVYFYGTCLAIFNAVSIHRLRRIDSASKRLKNVQYFIRYVYMTLRHCPIIIQTRIVTYLMLVKHQTLCTPNPMDSSDGDFEITLNLKLILQ